MSRKSVFVFFIIAASIACACAWGFTALAGLNLFTQIFSAAVVLHLHWLTNRRAAQ